jgi:hypothetical protein
MFTVACREAARYQDLQLVQLPTGGLCARVVPDGDAAVDQAAIERRALGPFDVAVEIVDTLERTPGGKLEEFVSHVVIP